MLFPMHITLLTIGVLFLLIQNFVWNMSLMTIGIGACLLAFISVFIDPSLVIFF
jgi:hypothetical protein